MCHLDPVGSPQCRHKKAVRLEVTMTHDEPRAVNPCFLPTVRKKPLGYGFIKKVSFYIKQEVKAYTRGN